MSSSSDIPPPEKRNLRLKTLPITSLPSHPSFSDVQKDLDVDLKSFISSYLQEAVHLTTNILPKHFKAKGGPRASPPSATQVQMLQCDAFAPEAWFARQSLHEDQSKDGTASWTEFKKALYYDHSPNEMGYTPDIYDARCIADWTDEIQKLGIGVFGADFEEVGMEIYEMAHDLPGGLTNRVFATLVVRALMGDNTLIVAQRPVDLSKASSAFYSNGKHLQEGKDKLQKGKVIIGQYSSVERAKKIEDGRIQWDMALTSDTGGWLPMSIQKMALPGAVAKDVGFVMNWMAKSRKKEGVAPTT